MEKKSKSPGSNTKEAPRHQEILSQLADLAGIEKGYIAADGSAKTISDATIHRVLSNLGFNADTLDAAEQSLAVLKRRQSRLPPVLLVKQGEPIEVSIPAAVFPDTDPLSWRLDLEDGAVLCGETRIRSIAPHANSNDQSHVRVTVAAGIVPLGYHQFSLEGTDPGVCKVIIVPERAYQPSRWQDGDRDWLLTVQLYSLRSPENWGIGDFGDLRRLIKTAATRGAAGIGLNPLHAPFPSDPALASPYSPSSRSFFNPIYLDMRAVPEFARCESAQRRLSMPGFQAGLEDARAEALVDYEAVWALKLAVLRDLYEHFITDAFSFDGTPLTQRGEDFAVFRERGGARLRDFARHQARQQAHRDAGEGLDWREWPADPDQDHARQESFFEYLQFETERQLAELQAFAREAGMAIGLYLDIAVGINPAGADGWTHQNLYVQGCSVGAPPDIDNPLGQDWGLVPANPLALRDQGFAPFIEAVRAAMAYAGAIRIDHILGLQRLWWVPHGEPAAEGAYVNYPLDEMLGILALESHRHRCVVIGEDLGTVPPGFRETLASRAILSYRLLPFERDQEDGRFIPPARYPECAAVGFSTHDLPTIQGLVTTTDLAWRRDLNLFPSEDAASKAAQSRGTMLAQLRDALGLSDTAMADPIELAAAIHAFLAATPARLVLVQIEDILGLREQMNLPGTVDQHPNWRRRLTVPVDAVLDAPLAAAVIDSVSIR